VASVLLDSTLEKSCHSSQTLLNSERNSAAVPLMQTPDFDSATDSHGRKVLPMDRMESEADVMSDPKVRAPEVGEGAN
jgi:hypothetical protein